MRRDLASGWYAERENLSFRCKWKTSSGEPDERESIDAEHRGWSQFLELFGARRSLEEKEVKIQH